jgi:hypothetical protein
LEKNIVKTNQLEIIPKTKMPVSTRNQWARRTVKQSQLESFANEVNIAVIKGLIVRGVY